MPFLSGDGQEKPRSPGPRTGLPQRRGWPRPAFSVRTDWTQTAVRAGPVVDLPPARADPVVDLPRNYPRVFPGRTGAVSAEGKTSMRDGFDLRIQPANKLRFPEGPKGRKSGDLCAHVLFLHTRKSRVA